MNIIKLILTTIVISSSTGCYYIGVEIISPQEFTPQFPKVRDYVDTTPHIISKLGQPDKRNGNVLYYRTEKRIWKGIVLDVAICPIPLTIPLMIPLGKDGYIKFELNEQGAFCIKEYGSRSTFYGFWGDDSGAGFSDGSKSGGFWFQ